MFLGLLSFLLFVVAASLVEGDLVFVVGMEGGGGVKEGEFGRFALFGVEDLVLEGSAVFGDGGRIMPITMVREVREWRRCAL